MENVEAMIYNEKDFPHGRQHKTLTVKQAKDQALAFPCFAS